VQTNNSCALAGAIALALSVGCKDGPDSIEPIVPYETFLPTSGDGDFDNLVVTMKVPAGYGHGLVRLGGEPWFELRRERRDPTIIVGTAWRAPDGDARGMSDIVQCADERVVRREPRKDGQLVVCGLEGGTLVGREYRWRDQLFQCRVEFRVNRDLDVPYDEGKPSAKRLADAIAICDSLSFRDFTDDDIDRLFELPSIRSLIRSEVRWKRQHKH